MPREVHILVDMHEGLVVEKPEGNCKVTACKVVKHYHPHIHYDCWNHAVEPVGTWFHAALLMVVHKEGPQKERKEAWVETVPNS